VKENKVLSYGLISGWMRTDMERLVQNKLLFVGFVKAKHQQKEEAPAIFSPI